MYDCHTDRKHPIFFDSVHNDLKIITFFDQNLTLPSQDKKNPPTSNFGTLNPPRFSVQEPHKHIFVMTQKRIYFCNSSLFLSSEPKKKVKKIHQKRKTPKKQTKITISGEGGKKDFVSDKSSN
jgi:hypothetical protein